MPDAFVLGGIQFNINGGTAESLDKYLTNGFKCYVSFCVNSYEGSWKGVFPSWGGKIYFKKRINSCNNHMITQNEQAYKITTT